MINQNHVRAALAACLLAAARGCDSGNEGDTNNTPATPEGGAAPPDTSAACTGGVLEADFGTAGPLVGPAVDPGSGRIKTDGKELLASTTYLHLKTDPTSQARFAALNGPVLEALKTQPGLLALQFARSSACGSIRTLSIWQDEAAMFGFVAGPAHAPAMAGILEVSAGGSVATSWKTSDPEAMGWAEAARRLAAQTGRQY